MSLAQILIKLETLKDSYKKETVYVYTKVKVRCFLWGT